MSALKNSPYFLFVSRDLCESWEELTKYQRNAEEFFKKFLATVTMFLYDIPRNILHPDETRNFPNFSEIT